MLSFVPEPIEQYVAAHTTPESDVFKELTQNTHDSTDWPQMLVGPVEGRFLKLLVQSIGARRVLEIGTFTGYSALMMAEGLPADGELVTCDVSKKFTDIAQCFWKKSPHGEKIRLILGPAIETIATLDGSFDAVFIDADKENYIAYWDACLPIVRSGGIIVSDNVLWSGKVLEPKEPIDHAVVAFNDHVRQDSRVETVMLPFRDGVSMSVKHGR